MQEPNQNDTSSSGPLSGLLQSLTQVCATVLAMGQTRLELLTVELQEEIQRTAGLLVWSFVALFAGGIGLFLLGMTVIFAFWESHRVLASILVTIGFFIIAAVAGLQLRIQLRNRPRLLDGTLNELARDRERLDERLRNRS